MTTADMDVSMICRAPAKRKVLDGVRVNAAKATESYGSK